MATTTVRRVQLRDVVFAGAAAGLIFASFEMMASAFVTGEAEVTLPLRMISAIMLGPATLDSHYSPVLIGITGIAVHLLLSVVFTALFAGIVVWIRRVTAGEFLTNSRQLTVAGAVFGTALWLINFYVIAPLAGWTWFPGNVHHAFAFVGHALFFGCPLGWIVGRTTREVAVL